MNVINIEAKSDNGLFQLGLTIYPPAAGISGKWEVYDNDGSGNGNHMGTFDTFTAAMDYATDLMYPYCSE